MANGYDQNWDINSYNKIYGNNSPERWQGENDYYKNVDSSGYYRPPGSFLPSGIGSFYNQQAPNTLDRGWQHQLELQKRPAYQAPEKTGIAQTIKNWTTPAIDFMKKMTAPMSPEKRAEVEAIQGGADKYGWGNLPGTGLQGNVWQGSGGRKINVRDPVTGTQILRDKNLQSAFGSKTIADMIQKKEDWAKGQFEKYGDEWSDDEHRGLSTKLYNYYKSKGLIDKWKGATPVDTTTSIDQISTTQPGMPTGGQGDYQRAPINVPDPSFSDPITTGHMGPGGVHYAYGGRAGYQGGELVEDESMFEATPGGMMEENIEEVQGEPSREQLEAIAFEIFQLPLEQ